MEQNEQLLLDVAGVYQADVYQHANLASRAPPNFNT
jgi:hypothetical protein